MLERCRNSDCADYRYYGGRGITVCDVWRNSYESFLLDVGRRPSDDHSIDRIHNNGNYEPGNIRWATALEQTRNRRPYSQWSQDRALEDLRRCAEEDA